MTTIQNLGSNKTSLTLKDGTEIFFSYSTPVAAYIPGRGYVKTDEKYSVTTSKHINSFVPPNAEVVPQSDINDLVP